MPNAGDLAFFRGDPHKRIDALIMRRTQSPWVHVGVVIGYGLMLSARSDGVRIEPLPDGATVAATGAQLAACDDALTWLLCRAGDAYGFGDIVNQAVTWLNAQMPSWLSWLELPTLSFARHLDCSHLALDFLRIGGYPFSPAAHIAVLQPENVTPGALAAIVLPAADSATDEASAA